jgi:hypothetical protein
MGKGSQPLAASVAHGPADPGPSRSGAWLAVRRVIHPLQRLAISISFDHPYVGTSHPFLDAGQAVGAGAVVVRADWSWAGCSHLADVVHTCLPHFAASMNRTGACE